MPPLPSRWLSEIGLAEFEASAINGITSYAQIWAAAREQADVAVDSFQAFVELGAVEFALAPYFRRGVRFAGPNQMVLEPPQPNQVFPLQVGDEATADAIFKTDCGPFLEHARKAVDEIRPWDVFTFAGDMSKFELLLPGAGNVNVLADPKAMQGMMDALAQRYNRAGLGSQVVGSGVLAAQGIVWSAKLALLRGEDYTEIQHLDFAAPFRHGPGLTQ